MQYARYLFIAIIFILLGSCSHFISKTINSDQILSPKKYEVKIYRDTWGVPHIFGKTDADAAYGLAYANAEDKSVSYLLFTLRQISKRCTM
jgi:acyl-homoserine lactone acylase PvdQ